MYVMHNPVMFIDPTGLFADLFHNCEKGIEGSQFGPGLVRGRAGGPRLRIPTGGGRARANLSGRGTGGTRFSIRSPFRGRGNTQSTTVFRSYISSNFRHNLQQLTGQTGANMQAHHVLPQADRFAHHFNRAGLNIHEPRFGSWVETRAHQQWSHQYNAKWDSFFLNNPNASADAILDFARELSQIYGFDVGF